MTFSWDMVRASPSPEFCLQHFQEPWFGVQFMLSWGVAALLVPGGSHFYSEVSSKDNSLCTSLK